MKDHIGEVSVSITLVLSLVGGVALALYTAITYVNAQVEPVQNQGQLNSTTIAAMQAQTADTNSKVNKLYDFFLQRGLNIK